MRSLRGDLAGARRAFEQAVALRKRLAEADRANAIAQNDLLESYSRLAIAEQRSYLFRPAAEHYDHALAVLIQLQKEGKGKPAYVLLRPALEKERDFCRAAERAVEDPDFARKQAGASRTNLLEARAGGLLAHGRIAEAAAAADELAADRPVADALYNAACFHARCAAAVAAAGPPPAEDQVRQEKYAARAVVLLRQAVRAGFKDGAHLRRDPDLDALRGRADFRELLDELGRKPTPE
jgi:hypothetical protein